jgi:N-acetylglucosamine kinase-like BadF-type ATPase
LGVDGGGTKTHAAIVDETGRFLGEGWAGSSNYHDQGVAGAQAAIAQAVSQAREAAGLPAQPFAAAFLGLGSIVSEADHRTVHAMARALELAPPERVGVDHDARIALAGGLSGRPGMALIAGTGSICYGRNAAGESWRAGGWGPLLSDEGSGYWLGLRALQIAAGAYDGRLAPSVLTERVLAALGIGGMDDLMHRVYVAGLSRAEIAALSRLTLDAAAEGDPDAVAALDEGARELARCVAAVARRLGFDAGPCELALAGGLFRSGDPVLVPLRRALADVLPPCRPAPAELPPALGACLLALHLDGVRANIQNLQRGSS